MWTRTHWLSQFVKSSPIPLNFFPFFGIKRYLKNEKIIKKKLGDTYFKSLRKSVLPSISSLSFALLSPFQKWLGIFGIHWHYTLFTHIHVNSIMNLICKSHNKCEKREYHVAMLLEYLRITSQNLHFSFFFLLLGGVLPKILKLHI